MRNLIFLLLLVVSFYSCSKQNKVVELPVEKLYIVEYNWLIPLDGGYKIKFMVIGFSELNKNYDLRYAFIDHLYDKDYNSSIKVIDSIKSKISDVITKYSTDTVFLYKGERGMRIYDGNRYIFIMQQNDSVNTKIYFEPDYLPSDLLFLYKCLYEDIKTHKWNNKYEDIKAYEWNDKYKNLFDEFEKIIRSGSVPPPPMLKGTIQFTPPVIVKKTHKRIK